MGTMSDHGLTSGSTPSDHGIDPDDFGGKTATDITVDVTGFSGNLGITDINVQHALDTIDQMAGGTDLAGFITSTSPRGGYAITNIRLDADKKIVITYDDTPIS